MKTSFWKWAFNLVALLCIISNAHSQPAMQSPSNVKFLTQFYIVDSTETNKEIIQQNVVLAIQQVLSTLHASEIVLVII